VEYMSVMLEYFFLFSVNFESDKIIVKSEILKKKPSLTKEFC